MEAEEEEAPAESDGTQPPRRVQLTFVPGERVAGGHPVLLEPEHLQPCHQSWKSKEECWNVLLEIVKLSCESIKQGSYKYKFKYGQGKIKHQSLRNT